MLSVTAAQQKILEKFKCLSAEMVHITEASDRVLESDLLAPIDLPPFHNSAMDGYALQASDTYDAPSILRVIGDIHAGHDPTVTVTSGTAARIMTGAPVPLGADAIVPVELTDDTSSESGGPAPSKVRVMRSVSAGDYVRTTGEDIRVGECILHSGRKVSPAAIGVMAALGIPQVMVVRSPKVAILATGDELVEVDQVPGPGQIRNSNSYSLTALVREAGGEALNLSIASDTVQSVRSQLQSAVSQGVDFIMTSAGVSVGAKDVVRRVIEQEGQLEFWRVNMRPGKPVVFGHYQNTPLLGLPGNPVSSIIAFEVFARPAILKLGGHTEIKRAILRVRLQESIETDGRETYFRAVVESEHKDGGFVARSAGLQGSHIMQTLINANALVIVPAGTEVACPGAILSAWMLSEIPGWTGNA